MNMTRIGNLVSRRRRVPSPPMIVALGALVLSAGGTVTAAVLITSANIEDNTVRSVDIRDETIRSLDVDNRSLTGADIKTGSLTGVDVKNSSLTGNDLKESTLGRVPAAANASNTQNAGNVDGLDANALIRVAQMSTDATSTLTDTEQIYGTALSLTAPRAGFVMIHGGTSFRNNGCTTGCGVQARLYHLQSDATSEAGQDSIAAGQTYAYVSQAWVFPVDAGVNTFQIFVMRQVGDGRVEARLGEVAAIYHRSGPRARERFEPARR
jgi:hypothetical protein